MDLGLTGKVALVTGAGSQIGFGKAIAVTLAREGCDLVLGDIDLEGARQTAEIIVNLGRRAIAVKADITRSAEVKDMVKAAIDQFGRIDILVNNAGSGTPPKLFVETTEEEWDYNIDLNLKGMLRCTKAVLEHMVPRKSGKIINISSLGAKTGGDHSTVYSAAKAGIVSFTKGLATEVAPLGINVNCIAPGVGLTNFVRNAPRDVIDELINKTPSRKTATPQDIANAVAYLASDVSIDIVGQTISVDGGLTMS
ncbi:MAG: SDR family NAD(P)-dependent oxidoreductase [Dehalococcoidales bacterium]|nr:SDR family NAD(P)-dependent oxidoreductase [Dehalococcoidales bacterium]